MNRYRLITKHINITFPKTSSILITQFLTLSLYIFSSSMSSIAHFPWLPLILWKLTLFLGLPCLFVLNVEVSQVLTLRSLLFFFFAWYSLSVSKISLRTSKMTFAGPALSKLQLLQVCLFSISEQPV